MDIKIKTFSDFENRLSELLKLELFSFARLFVRDKIEIFDLGCFPWESMFELSFLTDYEPDLKPEYRNNPADWRLYNFTSNCSYHSWYAGRKLANWMNVQYTKNSDLLERILVSCAKGMTSDEVKKVLNDKYNLSKDFMLRVVNPDDPDSKNYC